MRLTYIYIYKLYINPKKNLTPTLGSRVGHPPPSVPPQNKIHCTPLIMSKSELDLFCQVQPAQNANNSSPETALSRQPKLQLAVLHFLTSSILCKF